MWNFPLTISLDVHPDLGDFHRTLLYGGLWLYPPDSKAPEGKARLLYEVAPIGMLAEQAGGMATYGDRAEKRVLDAVPTSTHQKHPPAKYALSF